MYDTVKAKVAEDGRTTVMIKNIPNKYNKQQLLQKIDEHYKDQYDFFYLPIDFKVTACLTKNQCNMGYAFLNFLNSKTIKLFFEEFDSSRWEKFNSEKVC